jgi:hypothetical protein
MKQSSSWDGASKETRRLLRETKVNYHVHQSRPLLPVLSQMNLVLRSVLMFSSQLRPGRPSGFNPAKFYVNIFSLPCVPHALLTPFSFLWSPWRVQIMNPLIIHVPPSPCYSFLSSFVVLQEPKPFGTCFYFLLQLKGGQEPNQTWTKSETSLTSDPNRLGFFLLPSEDESRTNLRKVVILGTQRR